MKQDVKKEIVITEGVQVTLNGITATVKGPKGELSRDFFAPKVTISVKDGKVVVESKMATKRENKMVLTIASHIKNMIRGTTEMWTYELKSCSHHFPMNISVNANAVTVKNFLGEKKPRISKILPNVSVKIAGDKITVQSMDIETAGNMATRIEKLTQITGRDLRVFQDGIYITKKGKQ
jgi:large subunit ribosomal protein L6